MRSAARGVRRLKATARVVLSFATLLLTREPTRAHFLLTAPLDSCNIDGLLAVWGARPPSTGGARCLQDSLGLF